MNLSFDDLIPGEKKPTKGFSVSFADLIPQEDPGIMQSIAIGAGRTGDKVLAGMKQLGLGALVAGKQALGMDNAQELRDLSSLESVQQGNDQAYRGLQAQHPLATGVGETLPALAIPVGQATAMGRILAPALGMGAMEGAQYGSPQERALRAVSGVASGAAGGAIGEGVARAVMPVRSAMKTQAQVAAQAAADKIGTPLLPSQVTGSATLARIEDSLSRAPGSAGVMQDFMGRQKAALGRATNEAIRQEGDTVPQSIMDAAKASMGAEYNRMRASIPEGMPVTQPILDSVESARSLLSAGSTMAEGKMQALEMLKELKDKLYSSKALTPEEYSGWVSDLAEASRSIKNDRAKSALKQVGATMDAVARGPMNSEWQKLDQAYAALRTLQKSGAVNPQTGDVSIGRLSTYMRNHPSGANATRLADVKAFADAVPQLRAGSPTFERGEVGVSGALNALWRYPAAKALTSGLMRDYLAKGLMASPEASGLLANVSGRAAIPLAIAPAMGLLSPLYFQ